MSHHTQPGSHYFLFVHPFLKSLGLTPHGISISFFASKAGRMQRRDEAICTKDSTCIGVPEGNLHNREYALSLSWDSVFPFIAQGLEDISDLTT